MNETLLQYHVSVEGIKQAAEKLDGVITRTPLQKNLHLSEKYKANISLKREDLQVVRSYKIRGAYNKISSLTQEELQHGVVCASAGNHAQGVAYACQQKKIRGVIFMPTPTPDQKIKQVKMFGKEHIEVVLIGDTFDDAYKEAITYGKRHKMALIPPFDDEKIIEGQGTVGLEILKDSREPIDYLLLPVGGGGLASGIAAYFKEVSPQTKIIGVEPEGAAAMKASLQQGKVVTLEKIDKFVDGAAVKKVGDLNFEICKAKIDQVITVPEGKVCSEILSLYNEQAIVVEPAGALSIAALSLIEEPIEGKNIVCVVSGSNNDMTRTMEIKERSMLYEGLKHYFIVNFPQRAGALREFLMEVLGPDDDITHFEYSKKNNRERGPALIGLELKKSTDLSALIARMNQKKFRYEYVNDQPHLFHYLI
ncbi:MAG: threonine ammonia-lyase IlvA [Fulvivirga sp.]|nr:threonine ammonia-lyase IlvA [Fulvivirga sp.]